MSTTARQGFLHWIITVPPLATQLVLIIQITKPTAKTEVKFKTKGSLTLSKRLVIRYGHIKVKHCTWHTLARAPLSHRLTFQIWAAGRPPQAVPLVLGWQAFHLPRRAWGWGAVEVFCICLIRKVLWVRFQTLASWLSQHALRPRRSNREWVLAAQGCSHSFENTAKLLYLHLRSFIILQFLPWKPLLPLQRSNDSVCGHTWRELSGAMWAHSAFCFPTPSNCVLNQKLQIKEKTVKDWKLQIRQS